MGSSWSGRKVGRLRALTLQTKGTTCHLCGLPGADSPDHDPPRSVLVASGCLDPDDLRFLFPAHLTCSQLRGTRQISPELKAECRTDRLRREGKTTAQLSPRFARRRAERLTGSE